MQKILMSIGVQFFKFLLVFGIVWQSCRLNIDAIFLAVEAIFLLVFCSLVSNKFLRILLVLAVALHAVQILHIAFTGVYITPLTILNMENIETIGAKNVVLALGGLVLLVLFYCLGGKIRGVSSRPISVWFVVFVLLEAFSLGMFPMDAAVRAVYEASTTYVFKAGANDGTAFYRESAVDLSKSSWEHEKTRGNNVVLLITEGTSSAVISDKLTPHAQKLLQKSIVFDNYYNHTAATFRGIRGAFISGFQMKNSTGNFWQDSEVDNKFLNLPERLPQILQKNGYLTEFLSPHGDDENFYKFIKNLGFEAVNYDGKTHLSDKDAYRRLFERIEILSKQEKPFFIVVYLFGTHFGLDSEDLKFGDGTNLYLNKFYNQDVWLGEFLQKFENSPYAKDTLLIYTTDHATFATPEYQKTFGVEAFSFVDKIPLALYRQDFSPQVINAQGATSVALAPTILDILGIGSVENHFIGHSLFENTDRQACEYIYADGVSCISTKNGELKVLDFEEECGCVGEYYNYGG